MSLDVTINYKKPRQANYYLDHPYSYSGLTDADKAAYSKETRWRANITHNLCPMADNIPVCHNGIHTTLYQVCWHPEDNGIKTVAHILPLIIEGIHYMIDHRKELQKYDASNGWGTYNSFLKFLLNYKQACEDNDPACTIQVQR